MGMQNEILTIPEVANYFRVSRTTVWRWCNEGQLPAFKVGRIWRVRRIDLEHLLEEGVETSYQNKLDHDNNRGKKH